MPVLDLSFENVIADNSFFMCMLQELISLFNMFATFVRRKNGTLRASARVHSRRIGETIVLETGPQMICMRKTVHKQNFEAT
jgi:hypothetical protein